MSVQTKDLKLAQIRYYEKGRGTEVPIDKAYVFLLKKGDNFVNLFNPGLELPVYGRTLYSRSYYDGKNADGEDYGTLLQLASGEEMTGPCYVLEHYHDDKIFDGDTVTMEQLRAYIMNSKYFFMDSADIIGAAIEEYRAGSSEFRKKIEKIFPGKQLKSLTQKYADALEKKEKFEAYLKGCADEEVHQK